MQPPSAEPDHPRGQAWMARARRPRLQGDMVVRRDQDGFCGDIGSGGIIISSSSSCIIFRALHGSALTNLLHSCISTLSLDAHNLEALCSIRDMHIHDVIKTRWHIMHRSLANSAYAVSLR